MTKNLLVVAVVVILIVLGWYLFNNSNSRDGEENKPGGETKGETVEVTKEVVEDGLQAAVTVDYAWDVKDKPAIRHNIVVKKGSTALAALIKAVGEDNVEFEKLNSSGEVFITSINGVAPSEGKVWIYEIGYLESNVPPNIYKVKEGDKLRFIISVQN